MDRRRLLMLLAGTLAPACAGLTTGRATPQRTAAESATPETVPSPAPTAASDPAARANARLWVPGAHEQAEQLYIRDAAQLAPRETRPFAGPLSNWPVTGPITSPFGPRWGAYHNGLDIGSPMYTPVRAAAAGQVVLAGQPYLAYGDTAIIVVLAHGSGFATLYVHLDDTRLPTVKVGQRVAPSEILGYVGVTGWTTGPHVHFMTVEAGRAIDPRRYLP